MYLNETDAKNALKAIVETQTLDYKIYPIKRKASTALSVTVFFVVKVMYRLDEETLFTSFVKETVKDKYIDLIESQVIEENKALKEDFLFSCEINIFGV